MVRRTKKTRNRGRQRINWILVTAFTLVLIMGTYLLFSVLYDIPSPYVPIEDLLISKDVIGYINPRVNRFKFVNYSNLLKIPEIYRVGMLKSILTITEAGINLSETDLIWILQLEYPEAQQVFVANVLRLEQDSASRIESLLRVYENRVMEYMNTSVYFASPPPTYQQRGNAYFALLGEDFIYAEGGAVALRILKETMDLKFKPSDKLELPELRKTQGLILSIKKPLLALSLTFFEDPAQVKGARFVWNSLLLESSRLLAIQVVCYEGEEKAAASLSDPQSLFFSKEDRVYTFGNILAGVRSYKVDDLITALLSI